mgnify:CR=1 FL=1
MCRNWFATLLLVTVSLGFACDTSDSSPARSAGENVGDRYLRLFEAGEFGSSLFVYNAELPPNLTELLNPGLTAQTPPDDIVSIPAPADGVLLGSYDIRLQDGTHEIWIAYDVAATDPVVERQVRELMDKSPWQVTGGQSNELLGLVSFQSTVSGDINGLVTIQALPAALTFPVTVERDGRELQLELSSGAFIPQIDARFRELSNRLEVTHVFPDADFHVGDILVAVDKSLVGNDRDMNIALRKLGQDQGREPRTAVIYRVTIIPPVTFPEPVFAMPLSRPLPDGFPATFLIFDYLSVLEVKWTHQSAGIVYEVTTVGDRSAYDIASDYREKLASVEWKLLSDEAEGFATVLNFADAEDGLTGIATIDQFRANTSLNKVVLQIQVLRHSN